MLNILEEKADPWQMNVFLISEKLSSVLKHFTSASFSCRIISLSISSGSGPFLHGWHNYSYFWCDCDATESTPNNSAECVLINKSITLNAQSERLNMWNHCECWLIKDLYVCMRDVPFQV